MSRRYYAPATNPFPLGAALIISKRPGAIQDAGYCHKAFHRTGPIRGAVHLLIVSTPVLYNQIWLALGSTDQAISSCRTQKMNPLEQDSPRDSHSFHLTQPQVNSKTVALFPRLGCFDRPLRLGNNTERVYFVCFLGATVTLFVTLLSS